MATTISPTTARSTGRSPWTRRAWLCLLLLPIALAAAFFVGEGLFSSIDAPVGDSAPPLWTMFVAAGSAMLVAAVPAALAVWFALKGAAVGDRGGWLPAWILVGVTAVFVLLNLAAALFG